MVRCDREQPLHPTVSIQAKRTSKGAIRGTQQANKQHNGTRSTLRKQNNRQETLFLPGHTNVSLLSNTGETGCVDMCFNALLWILYISIEVMVKDEYVFHSYSFKLIHSTWPRQVKCVQQKGKLIRYSKH